MRIESASKTAASQIDRAGERQQPQDRVVATTHRLLQLAERYTDADGQLDAARFMQKCRNSDAFAQWTAQFSNLEAMPDNDEEAARHILALASAIQLCGIGGPHAHRLEQLLARQSISIETLRDALGKTIAEYTNIEPVTVHYPLCRPGSVIPHTVTVRSGELNRPGEVSFHRGQIDATVANAVVISLDSDAVARAWANKSQAIANGVGSRAEAWGKGSEAHAVTSGTMACAEGAGTSAWADEAYAIAFAKHAKAKAYATKPEAKAVAEAPNSTAIGMGADSFAVANVEGANAIAEKGALAVSSAAYTKLLVRDGARGDLAPYALAQSDGRATIRYGDETLTLARGNVVKGLANDYYRYQPNIDSEKHYIQAGRERFVKQLGDKKIKLGEGVMGAAYAYKKSDLVSKIEKDSSGASLNKKLAADLAETYSSMSQKAPWLLSYISVPTVMVKPNGHKVAHQPLIDGEDLSSIKNKLRPWDKEAILAKMLVVTRHAHDHGLHLTDQKNWMIQPPTTRGGEYRIGRLDIDDDPLMNHGKQVCMGSEIPGAVFEKIGKKNVLVYYADKLLADCQRQIAKEYGLHEKQAMGQLYSIVGPFAALNITGNSLQAHSYFGIPRAEMGKFIDNWQAGTATPQQVMKIYRAWRAWHPAPLNSGHGAVHSESAGALPRPLPPTPTPKLSAEPAPPRKTVEQPAPAPTAATGKPPRPSIMPTTGARTKLVAPSTDGLPPNSLAHPMARTQHKPPRPPLHTVRVEQPTSAPRPLPPRPQVQQPVEPQEAKKPPRPSHAGISRPLPRIAWETGD